MKNHWEYLQYYNERDLKIMTPVIDYLITLDAEDEKAYNIIHSAITSGLSNVMNRFNIVG